MSRQPMTRQKWLDVVFIAVMGALALLGLYYDPFPDEGCERSTERTENVFVNNATNQAR